MKISCEPTHGIKERREIAGLGELKFTGTELKVRFRSQHSFKPVSTSRFVER